MRTEAYTVSYDKINYHAPIPQGQIKEAVLVKREKDIFDNQLHYLGEYRLGVKVDEFFYREEKDLSTAEVYLAANESGPVRNKFQRAIKVREEKGLSVKRETAECTGFQKLEEQLLNNFENKLFVWVSPPGPAADGYGNYSYTFVGQAIKDPETQEHRARVIAYRNILSLQEHRNYLSYFASEARNYTTDTMFLANPVVFSSNEKIKNPEDVIKFIGEAEKISSSWLGKLKKMVGPLIQHYIDLVKINASNEELTQAKYAIENYTLAIKDQLGGSILIKEGPVSKEDLGKTVLFWGRHAPPAAAGSCGPSSSTLMETHDKNNKWEYHNGNCRLCGQNNIDVGPCEICKECEKKFDENERKLSV